MLHIFNNFSKTTFTIVQPKLSLFFIAILFLFFSCGEAYKISDDIAAQLPESIDYNYHIKPILSDRCYKCHGPDEKTRKANLRLDLEEGAIKKQLKNGGHAFVSKSTKRSGAFQRIITEDAELLMPPEESNLYISEYEKALIAKWIEQGAEFKTHWSFIPPTKSKIPEAYDNPIDFFIEEKLKAKGLSLSDPTQKEQLFRRINFDLTGLPPSVEAIDNFIKNETNSAFEKAINDLLNSKHYGERMALDWLDLARYADSHGYQDDGMRNTWPYRQWVINAFNNNLSYDQFITWQLAGDLLDSPSQDQLIATCFNRNHPQSQEGGVVDEEYRIEYVADRTNTIGKGIMGLTFRCARCHDHKYDPISQKEYYQFFAFFNNNDETGIVPYNGEASPTITPLEEDIKKKLRVLNTKVDSLNQLAIPENFQQDLRSFIAKKETLNNNERLLADFSFESEKEINVNDIYLDKLPIPKRKKTKSKTFAYFNNKKNKLDANIWGHEDERPELIEGKFGKGIRFKGDGGIRFNRDLDLDRQDIFSVSLWINLEKAGIDGPIFGKANGDFEGYRGWLCKMNKNQTLTFQLNHVWPNNSIDLLTMDSIPINEWTHLAMTYNGSSKADGLKVFINGKSAKTVTIKDNLSKSLLHGANQTNWSNLPFLLGIEVRHSISDIKMDELKVFNRILTPSEIKSLLENNTTQFSKETFAQLDENEKLQWYLQNRKQKKYNTLQDSIIATRAKINEILTNQPDVMVMKERDQPRPTFVLSRGAYDAPVDEVKPETPKQLPEFPEDFPRNRLGLASWITSKDNPLTARVYVNRLWSMCFGQGLVETQEDFGNQGSLPSHPKLLDHLAVLFVESGWDVKAMMKLILTSKTYQQSSIPSALSMELDPENKLYSRFSVHRLPAEFIRDQALKASGLLVDSIGGPSVYPYQPPGIWKALATRNATEYKQQSGDSLYRRSIYTVWKRSAPPPSMLNFDAPDRYLCTVRRQKTSTPLQALVLMNDPQYLEASRKLGERMIIEAGQFPEDQIQFAFKSLIGRPARPEEHKSLVELYDKEKEEFLKDSNRTKEWLSTGESKVDDSLDQTTLATCAFIAITIMNFDEFVIKR